VVVTLGEEGALAVSRAGTIRAPGFTVEVVDTVAAGDAFTGALAAALAEGGEIRPGQAPETAVVPVEANILRIANAAGALAVTVRGAQPSLPTRDRVEEFLRKR
jgi:ribokinase